MKARILFPLLAIFLLIGGSLFAETKLKIGYVNMNQAINQSNEGKRSKQFLEAQAEQKQQELRNKERIMMQKTEELKNSLMLSEAARQEKERELEQLRAELRTAVTEAQKSFRQDENRHMGKIFADIVAVVETISKKEGFDLVLENNVKQTILFSKFEMVDITEKVVAQYNQLQSLK